MVCSKEHSKTNKKDGLFPCTLRQWVINIKAAHHRVKHFRMNEGFVPRKSRRKNNMFKIMWCNYTNYVLLILFVLSVISSSSLGTKSSNNHSSYSAYSRLMSHLHHKNTSRSSISRPFIVKNGRIDGSMEEDSRKDGIMKMKPSKLYTKDDDNGKDSFMVFDQNVFDSSTTTTTEKLIPTTKRAPIMRSPLSTFLTQTDTGPKIRLEPFFNILHTFQSLALGTSKEQKFSPSYQAVAESVGQAQENMKAKRGKGTKGLRSKNKNKNKGLKKGSKTRSKMKVVNSNNNEKEDENNNDSELFMPVTIPKPLVNGYTYNEQSKVPINFTPFPDGSFETDIITLDSSESGKEKVHPLNVLNVPMTATLKMGGGGNTNAKEKTRVKGVVEDANIDSSPLRHDSSQYSAMPVMTMIPSLGIPKKVSTSARKKGNKKSKGNVRAKLIHFLPMGSSSGNSNFSSPGERRLRSEQFFHNFHNMDVDGDLNAGESFAVENSVIRPGHEVMGHYSPSMIPYHPSQYPMPPPGLGLPPKTFFSSQNSSPYPKSNTVIPLSHGLHPRPNEFRVVTYGNPNTNGHRHHEREREVMAITQQSQKKQKSVDTENNKSQVENNPNQKIGMDPFEVFYKQYKVLLWGGFCIVAALAALCIIVFIYVNNPPTEVVTAKGLLTDWINSPSPQILKMLSMIVDSNEKAGKTTGKRRRRKFKTDRKVGPGHGLVSVKDQDEPGNFRKFDTS